MTTALRKEWVMYVTLGLLFAAGGATVAFGIVWLFTRWMGRTDKAHGWAAICYCVIAPQFCVVAGVVLWFAYPKSKPLGMSHDAAFVTMVSVCVLSCIMAFNIATSKWQPRRAVEHPEEKSE